MLDSLYFFLRWPFKNKGENKKASLEDQEEKRSRLRGESKGQVYNRITHEHASLVAFPVEVATYKNKKQTKHKRTAAALHRGVKTRKANKTHTKTTKQKNLTQVHFLPRRSPRNSGDKNENGGAATLQHTRVVSSQTLDGDTSALS